MHVTIEPAADTGGYRMEVRGGDGAVLPGLGMRWVPAKAGQAATVNLLLEEPGVLASGSKDAVVVVARAESESGPALARGAARVVLEHGKVALATVKLLPEFRPLTGDGTLRFRYSAAEQREQVLIDLGVNSQPEWELNLWLVDDAKTWHWIGRPGESGTDPLAAPPGTGPLVGRFQGAQLSLEPAGMPVPMARSVGWKAYRGLLPPALLTGLRDALGSTGLVPAAKQIHADVLQHAGFARTSAGFTDDDAGVRIHSEHVYNSLAGATLERDFSGDGGKEYAGAEKRGLRADTGLVKLATSGVESVAEAVNDGVDRAAWIGQLRACRNATLAAVQDAMDAASELTVTPDVPHADTLIARAQKILEPADASPRTLQCVHETLELLTTVRLAPVPRGED